MVGDSGMGEDKVLKAACTALLFVVMWAFVTLAAVAMGRVGVFFCNLPISFIGAWVLEAIWYGE